MHVSTEATAYVPVDLSSELASGIGGAQVVKLLLQNRHVRLSPLALVTKALSDLVKVADMVELFTSRQQIIERAVSFFSIESLTVSDACTCSDKHVGIYRYYISAKRR